MLGDMAGLIVPVHPEDGGEIGYRSGPGSVHACSVPPHQTGEKKHFFNGPVSTYFWPHNENLINIAISSKK